MRADRIIRTRAAAVAAAALLTAPLQAHHSFAMYDMQVVRTFTGVVTRVDPAANHLQLYFAPMNQERKNVERNAKGEPDVRAIVIAGAPEIARQDISVNTNPAATI